MAQEEATRVSQLQTEAFAQSEALRRSRIEAELEHATVGGGNGQPIGIEPFEPRHLAQQIAAE